MGAELGLGTQGTGWISPSQNVASQRELRNTNLSHHLTGEEMAAQSGQRTHSKRVVKPNLTD